MRVSHDPVTSRARTQHPLRGTGGSEVNDDNPASADGGKGSIGNNNPCKLVSRAEVQAILGGSVRTSEAPLGPTCIYESAGSSNTVTLAIQATSFAANRPHISGLRPIRIGGHRAYCGYYGQPSMFLPLRDGRVLDVTGPCAIGTRFAAAALHRLSA